MRDTGRRRRGKPDESAAGDQGRHGFGHIKPMLTRKEAWLNARVMEEIAASNALERELRALESVRIAPRQES